MSKFATIYGLLYGDDHRLHRRLLSSLVDHAPPDEVDVRLWCNALCAKSTALVGKMITCRHGRLNVAAQFDPHNKPKYKAMKLMFHESWVPETPWVVWFDDDSYIDKADWWAKTVETVQSDPEICYMGQPWYVHHLPGQWEFIQQAAWFKGKPPELCPTRNPKVKKPGITFAQGAYWWLRTDVMKRLDWPDPRLNHNGGDTLLGEAVRQCDLPFTKFHYGVAVNKAKRRGFHERPAGSNVDTRR